MEAIATIRTFVFSNHLKIVKKTIKQISNIYEKTKIRKHGFTKIRIFYQIDPRSIRRQSHRHSSGPDKTGFDWKLFPQHFLARQHTTGPGVHLKKSVFRNSMFRYFRKMGYFPGFTEIR